MGEKEKAAQSLRRQHREKKPSNRRPLLLVCLALALALVCAAGYLISHTAPAVVAPALQPSATPGKPILLVEREKDEFQEATLTLAGETSYTLFKANGEYRLKEEPDFSVDQEKAGQIALAGVSMLYDEVIDAPGELDAYGLKQPRLKLDVTYTDGVTRAFLLGDQTPTGEHYYLMEDGNPGVYLLYAAVAAPLLTTRRQLHTASLPAIAVGDVQQASLTRENGETITVGYRPDIETLGVNACWLTAPIQYEADVERVDTYFQNIVGIRMQGFEATVAPGDLGMYGLKSPRYRLTVSVQSQEGAPVQTWELHIGAVREPDAVYASIDQTNDIYLLERGSIDFLEQITTPWLVDRFANIVSVEHVDNVRVTGEGLDAEIALERKPALNAQGEQRLAADGRPVYDITYQLNGEPLEESAFRKLYQLIIGTRVDGMIPKGSEPGQDARPVLSVQYRLNTHNGEERVEYVSYDANHYAVKRNGQCMFYLLKARVRDIFDGFAAYFAGAVQP